MTGFQQAVGVICGYRVAIVAPNPGPANIAGPFEQLHDVQLYAPSELELAMRFYKMQQMSADAEGCDVQMERAIVVPSGESFEVVYQVVERVKGPDP